MFTAPRPFHPEMGSSWALRKYVHARGELCFGHLNESGTRLVVTFEYAYRIPDMTILEPSASGPWASNVLTIWTITCHSYMRNKPSQIYFQMCNTVMVTTYKCVYYLPPPPPPPPLSSSELPPTASDGFWV